MKRINNLFEKIIDINNLYLAYQKAKQGKSSQYGIKLFDRDFENNIYAIQKELFHGTYRTSEYSIFTIHDPKERIVYRLPFRDRIVHHAIMNILEPIWRSIFISNSYSCIKGRGIHGALIHLKRDLRDYKNTTYCLKLDVKKYYPSIDHDILKSIILKKLKDVRLLSLLNNIIDSAPGVPIGNYLSQYFSNIYLSYFDHWIKECKKVKYYYRYADDMIILHKNKNYLHDLLSEIRDYLNNELKLQLKDNYQIFPVDKRGIDFVGYVFRHQYIRMRKSIKKNFARRASKLNKRDICSKEYKKQLCSWTGWAKHCNSKHLVKKIMKHE